MKSSTETVSQVWLVKTKPWLDEEDQIEETIHMRSKKNVASAGTSKFERAVRSGRTAQDKSTLGFANYFTAQKVRAKISQQDEKIGNTILLKKIENKKKTK